MEKPKIVIRAEKMIAADSSGKIKDPVTGRTYAIDYGSLKLIVDLYNSSVISDDLKEKFFKLPLQKITNFLWRNAEFKR